MNWCIGFAAIITLYFSCIFFADFTTFILHGGVTITLNNTASFKIDEANVSLIAAASELRKDYETLYRQLRGVVYPKSKGDLGDEKDEWREQWNVITNERVSRESKEFGESSLQWWQPIDEIRFCCSLHTCHINVGWWNRNQRW